MFSWLSLDSWTTLMLGMLALAAFAATVGWVSTYAVSELQREEAAAAKKALEKYKADAAVKIEQAEAVAATANERAKTLELEIERIRAPRKLSQAQIEQAATELKQFTGTPFVLTVYTNAESGALSLQVESILLAAGWTQKASGGDLVNKRPGKPDVGVTSISGLFVQIDKNQKASLHAPAEQLVRALQQTGLVVTFESGNFPQSWDKSAIRVSVGEKPL